MQISEFIEANNRLEKYYEKEFTTEQMQIMYEELKDLSIERYKKLISLCIKTCKFMPKIADILKANGDLIDQGRETSQREITMCKKCDKTGYVLYTQFKQNGNTRIPYTYAARCMCQNAVYANGKVPTYQELGVQIGERKEQVSDSLRSIEQVKSMLIRNF